MVARCFVSFLFSFFASAALLAQLPNSFYTRVRLARPNSFHEQLQICLHFEQLVDEQIKTLLILSCGTTFWQMTFSFSRLNSSCLVNFRILACSLFPQFQGHHQNYKQIHLNWKFFVQGLLPCCLLLEYLDFARFGVFVNHSNSWIFHFYLRTFAYDDIVFWYSTG